MGAVNRGDEIIPEDLSKAMILSDMRQAIVTSRLKKGETLNAMEFKYGIEKMGERNTNPPPENADVKNFEGDEQKLLWQRAQEFWRTPRVSKISEKVDRNADLTKGKYNKLVTKKIKEQKRDVEFVLLSDQDAAEDTGLVGSKMMAMGRFFNDGTLAFGDQLTAIPDEFRTPAAQIYTGTLADLDEDTFKTMLRSCFDNLGTTGEFTLFAGSALKAHISDNFGNYRKDKEGYTVVLRTDTDTIDRKKVIASSVDVYETEFGIFDIELTSWMPSTYRGYGIDMEQVELRPLMWCDHTELPYQGGGRSGLIDSILSWKGSDPRCGFKVAPSDEATGAQTGEGR